MPVTLDYGKAEWLVHAYSDLILRLSYTYLKSIDDAQDICQTIFLKLLQKPQALSSSEREKVWIIRTAVNLCKDRLKSGWWRAVVALDTVEAVLAPAEEKGGLLSAVSLLLPKYHTVTYLYYYEGYTVREIAQLLGEEPATVSTRSSRGHQRLRTLSKGEGMT